ncbi:MAG TPA: hypothetical protein VJ936_03990 [Desulfobacteraceae bacterium]|nr:hypothetical protein [Desulfobacteraceae bacterium]
MNPFGTTRVDTPFQDHADLKDLFSDQFSRIKAILEEVGSDRNHQSRGVVLAGGPGSGKTHLIMRLARDIMASHRILFIRQPNNAGAVFFHTYSRMIESLVENVPGTEYSQIEYLLAKSFSKIVISSINRRQKATDKMVSMKKLLSDDHLNIYRKLGRSNSEKRRNNWRFIEKRTLEWWGSAYGFGGFSASIVKALIKYCSHTDSNRREIVRKWLAGTELSPSELKITGLENLPPDTGLEAFAMEAMGVLGRLSIEDQPLIIVFDQLEGLKHNEELLRAFGESVKELFTHIPNTLMLFNLFPSRWKAYASQLDPSVVDRMSRDTIFLDTPSREEMLALLRFRAGQCGQDIHSICSFEELEQILSHTTIRKVLNAASDYYRFKMENIPLPRQIAGFEEEIRSQVMDLKEEIAALKAYLNIETPTLDQARQTMAIKGIIEACRERATEALEKDFLISGSDDAGKLQVVLSALTEDSGLRTTTLKKGARKLPHHVMAQAPDRGNFVAGFLHAGARSFSARLKNFNDLCTAYKNAEFIVFRDQRAPAVRSKLGIQEIKRLNASENGTFQIMDRENRIVFETIYRLITDIQNREVDLDTAQAVRVLRQMYRDYWLIKLIG